MRLTCLRALWQLFSASSNHCCLCYICTSSFLVPSVPLWIDGMEEAVVYPDKLPIVSGGNSLWGHSTTGTRLGTERETNRRADCAAVVGRSCTHPLGSDARGKPAIPWDDKRCCYRDNNRE